MDVIPVFSQIKSCAQWATGHSEGALETQKNFFKLCPVVSQVTSLVQKIAGDGEGAIETQIKFLKGVWAMVDSVPVVGHVKGTLLYICGDKEGGNNAMKAATRTTCVICGGVTGFMVGGPVGASVGGAIGGVGFDVIISFCDWAVNREKAKPYGVWGNLVHIIEDPTDGGNYVDLIGTIVLDGMTGYIAGNAIGKKIKYNSDKRNIAKTMGEEGATLTVDAGEDFMNMKSENEIKDNKPQLMTKVKENNTGKTYNGYNKQLREVLKMDKVQEPTELQRRAPDASNVLGRNVSTCSEQEAYNAVYTDNPDASPNDLTSATIVWNPELQGPVTVKRCSNCLQYTKDMGKVVTDLLNETLVPKRVRFRKTALVTSLGVGVRVLSKNVES